MSFTDMRSRCLVFCSHCILDQNARFPGIAVRPGTVESLVSALLATGMGIEQLPCCEMRYWGGVSRRLVLPVIQMSPRLIASRLKPLAIASLRIGWRGYEALCRREAVRTSRVIEDFIARGYTVAGVVAMNDSPTCGLDMTLKIPELLEEAWRAGVDWSHPDLEKMSVQLPALLQEGCGAFMGALRERVRARGLQLEFLGFDPWGDDKQQASEIVSRLEGRR